MLSMISLCVNAISTSAKKKKTWCWRVWAGQWNKSYWFIWVSFRIRLGFLSKLTCDNCYL